MSTPPYAPAAGLPTPRPSWPSPVIVERYGALRAVRSDHETRVQWRGDVAYAKAMPFGPWLLALPVCPAIAFVQALASDGHAWSFLSFLRHVVGYALAICVPGWMLAFVGVRVALWLYGRFVRTSLILSSHGIVCLRHGPLGTTALVPAGSTIVAVHEDEHVEKVRTRRVRFTLARHAFVCVHLIDGVRRRHGIALGHGLDDEGRRALMHMLRDRNTPAGAPRHTRQFPQTS